MKERFEGGISHRPLVDTLAEQKIVRGSKALAEEIATRQCILEGSEIIT